MAESNKIESIISEIESLTVLELNSLVEALENKFGVVAAAPAMATATGVNPTPAQAEEKSEYNVEITDAGANKIGVIKAVREINPALGLKEAKDLVEAAPKVVAENVKVDDAKAAKEKLEAAGAKVELK